MKLDRFLFIVITAAVMTIWTGLIFGATIKVGPAESIKTLADGVKAAQPNDVVTVADGTYPQGKDSITITRPLTIMAAKVGAHPLVTYDGKTEGMAPIIIPLNVNVAVNDLAFSTPGKTYAFAVEGGLASANVIISGEGGGVMSKGSSGMITARKWSFTNWRVNSYDFYIGPKTLKDNGSVYIQRPGAGVELDSVIALNGNRNTHGVRVMNVDACTITNCTIANDPRQGAALRIHNVRRATLADSRINGDTYFAPMAEGDGGTGLPPGPKRSFCDAWRLENLTVTNTIFTTGDFKITPGLLNGRFTDCTITDTKGSSVIDTPFPYMTRPRSGVAFERCSFKHGDGSGGRVFSDENGAQSMRARDCRFLNKPYTH